MEAVIVPVVMIGLIVVLPTYVAQRIGRGKGRKYTWLLGITLGWIGVLIAAMLDRKYPPEIEAPARLILADVGRPGGSS